MSLINPIVFDPSREIDLYARINRDGVAQTLTFTASDGNPYTVNTKTWQLNVKRFDTDSTNVLQLLSGSGLTINATSIVIAPTATQTASIQERGYYYELYNVTDKQTWLCGTFYFHNGKFDNYYASGANTITVTVSALAPPRIYTVASIATLTPDISTYDSFEITAQAEALTIANPTGAIGNFEGFVIRLTDNGTSRAISYGNKYRAFGSALPTATNIGKTIYLICIYNSTDDVYDTASREEV
jgi:hypothetical protein